MDAARDRWQAGLPEAIEQRSARHAGVVRDVGDVESTRGVTSHERERIPEPGRRDSTDHRHDLGGRPGFPRANHGLRDRERQIVDPTNDHRVRRDAARQRQGLAHIRADEREIEQDRHEREATPDRLRGCREALAAFVVEAHDDRVHPTVRDLLDDLGRRVGEFDGNGARQRAREPHTLGCAPNQRRDGDGRVGTGRPLRRLEHERRRPRNRWHVCSLSTLTGRPGSAEVDRVAHLGQMRATESPVIDA